MACPARAHSRYCLGDFAFRPLLGKHRRFGFAPIPMASIFVAGFIVILGADGVTGDLMRGFIAPLFNAVLMLLEPLLPVLTLQLSCLLSPNLRLTCAIILHQRNVTGTDIGTGATFDTVEQAMCQVLLVVMGTGKGIELLR